MGTGLGEKPKGNHPTILGEARIEGACRVAVTNARQRRPPAVSGATFPWASTSTRTRLKREPPPLWRLTADFAQPKCRATSAISSALALPSTGGDFSQAVHVPSGS